MEDAKVRVSRNTLKLKSPAVRKSVSPPVSPPASPPAASSMAPKGFTKKKPDAASWADEHKHRMQADMDALGFVNPPPTERRR